MTVIEPLRMPSLGGATEWPATDGAAYAKKFSGRRRHRIIKGVGHKLPQEAPHTFADAVVEVDSYRPACARATQTA
jgi:pimeloyl-ACP methyl ester carboxylesterase